MKASEFYEKHWRVKNAVGELVPPKPLTDAEKEFLDTAAQYPNCMGVIMTRQGRRAINIDVQYLNEQLKKLPDYLQPKTT